MVKCVVEIFLLCKMLLQWCGKVMKALSFNKL